MSEEPLGILLYGYDREAAFVLKEQMKTTMGTDITLLSASKREADIVMTVLETPSEEFEDKESKILVFLGFDNEKISKVLDEFPKDGNIIRPIFCGLTEQNVSWPVSQLVEHLLEEDKAWRNTDQ